MKTIWIICYDDAIDLLQKVYEVIKTPNDLITLNYESPPTVIASPEEAWQSHLVSWGLLRRFAPRNDQKASFVIQGNYNARSKCGIKRNNQCYKII